MERTKFQQSELDAYASDFPEEGSDVVGGIRKYRRLIKDIREHLKKKLPSYSVPTCAFILSYLI